MDGDQFTCCVRVIGIFCQMKSGHLCMPSPHPLGAEVKALSRFTHSHTESSRPAGDRSSHVLPSQLFLWPAPTHCLCSFLTYERFRFKYGSQELNPVITWRFNVVLLYVPECANFNCHLECLGFFCANNVLLRFTVIGRNREVLQNVSNWIVE